MPIKKEMLQKFFYYVVEREKIRKRKERGESRPWTEDRLLHQFKFTNVHRINDKTTRYFKEIYDQYAPLSTPGQTLMNCATLRYFGTIAFAAQFGWMKTFNRTQILDAVEAVRTLDQKPFTGAYVITNGGQTGPKEDYVVGVLKELSLYVDDIARSMITRGSWEHGAELLRRVSGFGGTGFMAKETLQDFLLTVHARDIIDRDTWTPVGPGARRGIVRITGGNPNAGGLNNHDNYWLGVCREIQEKAKEYTEIPMTAHDVQFCLCEFDKYCRAQEGGHMKNRYKESK